MKQFFGELQVGQLFEFELDVYVKTSLVRAQKIGIVCINGMILHLTKMPDLTTYQDSWKVTPIILNTKQ